MLAFSQTIYRQMEDLWGGRVSYSRGEGYPWETEIQVQRVMRGADFNCTSEPSFGKHPLYAV